MNKGRIPQELFDQVIAQSDIVDVVSDYVQLTKAGKNYKGLCPFPLFLILYPTPRKTSSVR